MSKRIVVKDGSGVVIRDQYWEDDSMADVWMSEGIACGSFPVDATFETSDAAPIIEKQIQVQNGLEAINEAARILSLVRYFNAQKTDWTPESFADMIATTKDIKEAIRDTSFATALYLISQYAGPYFTDDQKAEITGKISAAASKYG